jgi:site-specific DNA-methyltransferase (adenine-specific)
MNNIICGDAFELIKQVPDKSVDLILWDPDYGVGVDYGNGKIARDYALEFVVEMLKVLKPKSKTGQAIVFWSGSNERVKAFYSSPIDSIWPIHYLGIWYKPNGAGSSGNGLARRFETWFWLKDGDKPKSEWGHLPDVLSECRVVPGHKEAVSHPSQKPVKLLERLIRFFTKPGDLILDPTIGSGSTAVASIQTGRNFIGFELNAEYVQMANTRIATAQPPLFVANAAQQIDVFAAVQP